MAVAGYAGVLKCNGYKTLLQDFVMGGKQGKISSSICHSPPCSLCLCGQIFDKAEAVGGAGHSSWGILKNCSTWNVREDMGGYGWK
jgi:hypothetical protein